MFGLTMYEEYLIDILKGYRSYDARMYQTNKRGRIALIKSNTNLIYGFVDFVSISQITYDEYIYWHVGKNYSIEEAEWDIEANNKYYYKKLKRAYAYNFKNPVLLDAPIKIKIINKTGNWIEFDENEAIKPFKKLKLF